MSIQKNELNQNAMGGTELMELGLRSHVDNELLDNFQIISSRVRELDPNKKKIYWLHDLPGDPEVQHLKAGGYKKFDKLVFVSHWQQQMYNAYLGIPFDAGVVLRNAITPIDYVDRGSSDKLKLIYTSTPHRGLALLYPVFQMLANQYPIELEVFSSFGLYGWPERDKPYEKLFDDLRADPRVTYHGAKSNAEVRKALQQADIFVYPSIWQETSCLCLIEAMSAGLTCIHSSLAALPETSMGLTAMYRYTEDPNKHANLLYNYLVQIIDFHMQDILGRFTNTTQRELTNNIYGWDRRAKEWEILLKQMC